MIDLWGSGLDVAQRMGLLPGLRQGGYGIEEVRLVNEHGQRVGGFRGDVFRLIPGGRFMARPSSGIVDIGGADSPGTSFGLRPSRKQLGPSIDERTCTLFLIAEVPKTVGPISFTSAGNAMRSS
jgi:hypothetical protein